MLLWFVWSSSSVRETLELLFSQISQYFSLYIHPQLKFPHINNHWDINLNENSNKYKSKNSSMDDENYFWRWFFVSDIELNFLHFWVLMEAWTIPEGGIRRSDVLHPSTSNFPSVKIHLALLSVYICWLTQKTLYYFLLYDEVKQLSHKMLSIYTKTNILTWINHHNQHSLNV